MRKRSGGLAAETESSYLKVKFLILNFKILF